MRDTEDDDEVAEATEELLRDIGIQLTIAQLDSTAKPTGVGSIRRYYGRAGCSKTWYRRTQTSDAVHLQRHQSGHARLRKLSYRSF
jgi:hypothetical protein